MLGRRHGKAGAADRLGSKDAGGDQFSTDRNSTIAGPFCPVLLLRILLYVKTREQPVFRPAAIKEETRLEIRHEPNGAKEVVLNLRQLGG
jgi:hypothetical protein